MIKRMICVLAAGAAVAVAQQKHPEPRAVEFRGEKEAALGTELAKGVRKNTTPLESAAVTAYVEDVGHRLAAEMPATDVRWSFEVIADLKPTNELAEPIALPGGYVFVPAGLFLAAKDEAEFACMLAHAMAHVAERHGTRVVARGQIANLGSIPLGWNGVSSREAIVPVSLLKYRRAFETEADVLAVQAMARAGYDPEALVRYVERMQTDASGGPPAFSPFPPREERVAAIRTAMTTLPARTYQEGAGFKNAQEEVRRLVERPKPTLLR